GRWRRAAGAVCWPARRTRSSWKPFSCGSTSAGGGPSFAGQGTSMPWSAHSCAPGAREAWLPLPSPPESVRRPTACAKCTMPLPLPSLLTASNMAGLVGRPPPPPPAPAEAVGTPSRGLLRSSA
ncbi:unnamed protein product, partial [Ectocarpus sp. 12 AP-2014]